MLGLSRLLTLVVPFRLVRPLLGGGPATEQATVPVAQRRRARRIGGLIGLAAARTPWRSECYPQALTARVLLGAAGIAHRTSFGVRRVEESLAAHVWVDVDGETVVGGDTRGWTTVGTFRWSPRHGTGR